MINYAVVGASLVVYIVVSFIVTLPDPPIVKLMAGAVALTLFVSLVFFPFSKTLWAAIDLILHPEERTN